VAARPPLEVADVFRHPEVRALVGRYPASHQRVVRAITACRTAVLGGHVDECDECGHEKISYNSCRDRHCPKCEGSAAADWVSAQQNHLLPVPYCHAVFTLPQELAGLALQNQQRLYALLFRAVSETLPEVARDPRHLGARLGFLAILHTWGQKLELHPHLHCLIPAGGIAPDRSRWIPCRTGFFLPVRVLSRVFRRKYLAGLEEAYESDQLRLAGELSELKDPRRFEQLTARLRAHDWVVYARPPFGGSDQVLKYLARYTHRVAISNRRIRALQGRQVTFEWKDYAQGHRPRTLTLDVAEFARRFLLHVLPERFIRIRYYGFLASACRRSDIALCRQLIDQPAPTSTDATGVTDDAPNNLEGRCPACRSGRLFRIRLIAPDTS
jgi:hypothetical protein